MALMYNHAVASFLFTYFLHRNPKHLIAVMETSLSSVSRNIFPKCGTKRAQTSGLYEEIPVSTPNIQLILSESVESFRAINLFVHYWIMFVLLFENALKYLLEHVFSKQYPRTIEKIR